MNSISDYVNAILNNKISSLKVDKERLKFKGTESITLPFEIRDGEDKVIGKHWRDFI